MTQVSTLLAATALTIAGCTNERLAMDLPPPSALSGANVAYSTQVSIGRCTSLKSGGESLEAIASGLLTSAIGIGVDRLGKALTALGKDQEGSVLATRNVEFSGKTFEETRCLQIVRGWMHRNKPSGDGLTVSEAEWPEVPNGLPRDVGRFLHENAIYPAARPDFFFEGLISRSISNQNAALTPLMAWLDEPLKSDRLSPLGNADHRFVAVAFSIQEGGGTAAIAKSGDTYSGGTLISLGRLQRGTLACFDPTPATEDDLFNGDEGFTRLGFPKRTRLNECNGSTLRLASASIPTGAARATTQQAVIIGDTVPAGGGSAPAAPPGNTVPAPGQGAAPTTAPAGNQGAPKDGALATLADTATLIHAPNQSEWFTLDLKDKPAPYTLRGLVTETRKGSEFFEFLAEVFNDDSNKQLVKDTIIATVVPESDADFQSRLAKRVENLSGAGDAIVLALSASAACIAEPVPAKAQALRAGLFSLNAKYLVLGRSQPVSAETINAIPLVGTDADAVAAACTSADGRLAVIAANPPGL